MTSSIAADTDRLRAVAGQMRAAAEQIRASTGSACAAMDALDATWSGSARDRGMDRWAAISPLYPPAADQLDHFAAELDALAARLDEASAHFGDGAMSWPVAAAAAAASGGAAGTQHASAAAVAAARGGIAGSLPHSMADIFDTIEDDKNRDEIKVFRVSEDEYAVTFRGTEGHFLSLNGMNNWTNAAANGLGRGTFYTRQVKSVLSELPPGAKLHLFGYSQGGLVAQHIVDEQRFLKEQGLSVASVSTFGSPKPWGPVSGVDYSREFDAQGDLVSKLAPPGIVPNSESIMALDIFHLREGGQTHTDAYNYGSTNEVRQRMESTTLPFTPDRWDLVASRSDSDVSARDTFSGLYRENVPEHVQRKVDSYLEKVDTAKGIGIEMFDTVKDTGRRVLDGLDPR